jgi:hypothetical protein
LTQYVPGSAVTESCGVVPDAVVTSVVTEHPPPSARGIPTPTDRTTAGVTLVSVAAIVPWSPVVNDRAADPFDVNVLENVKPGAVVADVGVEVLSLHAIEHMTRRASDCARARAVMGM